MVQKEEVSYLFQRFKTIRHHRKLPEIHGGWAGPDTPGRPRGSQTDHPKIVPWNCWWNNPYWNHGLFQKTNLLVDLDPPGIPQALQSRVGACTFCKGNWIHRHPHPGSSRCVTRSTQKKCRTSKKCFPDPNYQYHNRNITKEMPLPETNSSFSPLKRSPILVALFVHHLQPLHLQPAKLLVWGNSHFLFTKLQPLKSFWSLRYWPIFSFLNKNWLPIWMEEGVTFILHPRMFQDPASLYPNKNSPAKSKIFFASGRMPKKVPPSILGKPIGW